MQPVVFLVLAAIAAASMWFYVIRILRVHQIVNAEQRQVPRGNLSDLYPRWLGTRDLLLEHRNPYSREVTLEIQEGYYGRRLDPQRPNDPKDQEGFAYPVYVVFLLAPLVKLPFPVVLKIFYWFLGILTGVSVCLWLRVLRWRTPTIGFIICMLLALGSFPAVQGIKLQQLSLLVAALLAAAAASTASGFLFLGGALLAVATIKPQLTWPLAGWLLLWAVSDWRARRKFVFGFGLTMSLLLTGAEIILPGWWRMFLEAIRQYREYTQSQSVIEVMLGQILGATVNEVALRVTAQAVAAIAVSACAVLLWNLRRARVDEEGFGNAIGLASALTVLVVPMYAPYNQVLLLPALLLMARERTTFLTGSRIRRFAFVAGVFIVGWQWIASLGLSATYFLSRELALQAWQWPFFATFALPVWVFALTYFCVQGSWKDSRSET